MQNFSICAIIQTNGCESCSHGIITFDDLSAEVRAEVYLLIYANDFSDRALSLTPLLPWQQQGRQALL